MSGIGGERFTREREKNKGEVFSVTLPSSLTFLQGFAASVWEVIWFREENFAHSEVERHTLHTGSLFDCKCVER